MVEEWVLLISLFLPEMLKAMEHVDFLYLLQAPSVLKARWHMPRGMLLKNLIPKDHLNNLWMEAMAPSFLLQMSSSIAILL